MTGSDLLAMTLGFAAAAAFTSSFALQQRANLVAMASGRRGATPVVRRPEWIAGMVMQPVAFGLQAAALAFGPLALVIPTVATQLVFMVPAGAWVVRRRPEMGDVAGGAAVLVGVVAFVVASQPEAGRDSAPPGDWVLPTLAVMGVWTVLFLLGRSFPAYRASLWGAGVGIWGAIVGAFAKQLVATASDGLGAVLSSWATWFLLLVGVTNVVWSNLALRSGRLSSALSTMASLTPVAALLYSVTVFEETFDLRPAALVVTLAGVAVAAAGVVSLARSPSLLSLGAASPGDHSGDGPAEAPGAPKV